MQQIQDQLNKAEKFLPDLHHRTAFWNWVESHDIVEFEDMEHYTILSKFYAFMAG